MESLFPTFADLHAHTTASDGTSTPSELVRTANDIGLTYLAVTDHDTTAGLSEAAAMGATLGVRILNGVELSAEGAPGKCHLLGLGIDPGDRVLRDTLSQLSESRRVRNQKISERLTALGVPLSVEEVKASAPPGANIGRPHFAQSLINKGYVSSLGEAFDRYLADSASAYVTRETLTPAAAIQLVHDAGGLCFIAHPGLLRLAQHETYETRFRALQGVGLDGIEAYYSAYAPALTNQLLRLATKMGLLVTGGSDYHGANKVDVPLGIVNDGQRLPTSLLPAALLDLAI